MIFQCCKSRIMFSTWMDIVSINPMIGLADIFPICGMRNISFMRCNFVTTCRLCCRNSSLQFFSRSNGCMYMYIHTVYHMYVNSPVCHSFGLLIISCDLIIC